MELEPGSSGETGGERDQTPAGESRGTAAWRSWADTDTRAATALEQMGPGK